MSRDRRLLKELDDIKKDQDNSGVYAWPIKDDSLKDLKGSFPAPPDTPYAGGTYEVEINIPDNYPFKSPRMRFITKIWHPNISSQTGAICLDTLSTNWSPVQTIKTALLSLRMLLEVPNPNDPQDAEVAKMMIDNPVQFARTAQNWAIQYAGAPQRDLDLKPFEDMKKKAQPEGAVDDTAAYRGYNRNLIGRFTSMGFPVPAVVNAFLHFGIPNNGGADFPLEEAWVGDITARLLGEV